MPYPESGTVSIVASEGFSRYLSSAPRPWLARTRWPTRRARPLGALDVCRAQAISLVARSIAEDSGEIRYGAMVKQVLVDGGAATGVELEDGTKIMADAVVMNADVGYAATSLFAPGLVGGGTHPGSGLPTIYESGVISAMGICQRYGTNCGERINRMPP